MAPRKSTKKAKQAVSAAPKLEAPAPAVPKKPKLRYKAISIGKNKENRWATMLDTIEDGVVVHRHAVVEDTSRGVALERLKIYVIRSLLQEDGRVL